VKVRNWKDVPGVAMGEQAPGVTKRVLVGPEEGAGNFVMRLFSVARGGATPLHKHDWEHEVFVLDGQGAVVSVQGSTPLRPGDTLFVPPDEKHCLANTGPDVFRFICLVPLRGEDTC
jgi:quercetin dioxygenase-like cupin family protein